MSEAAQLLSAAGPTLDRRPKAPATVPTLPALPARPLVRSPQRPAASSRYAQVHLWAAGGAGAAGAGVGGAGVPHHRPQRPRSLL